MYNSGEGTGKDLDLAAYWLKKSAEQGFTDAEYNLGYEYFLGGKEFGFSAFERDKKQAIYWFERAAKKDHAAALYSSADMYFNGKGAEVNKRKAIDYWEKAAKLDHKRAYWKLSQLYLTGNGIEKDEIKSKQYRLKAAELGSNEAQYALSKEAYDRFDYDEAFKWLVKVANAEYPIDAVYDLAELYYNGEGTEKDLTQAIKWYEKAANTGDKEAQFDLGLRYANGNSVAQNHAKAIEWYKKAAKQENPYALNNLGVLKEKGYPVDLVRVGSQTLFSVKEIYKKSCELGNQTACENYRKTPY